MQLEQELAPDAIKAMDTIKKLLNLAAKAGTPEEGAAAAAKAQELLARHNLDVATVEGARPEDGKREEAKVEGGFYQHQRDIWAAVAQLNFCYYWCQQYRVEGWGQYHPDGDRYAPTKKEWRLVTKKRHILVGRTINTRATMAMASYLEQAVERLTRDRLRDLGGHNFSAWAMSFRKGVATTLIEKLEDKRRTMLQEERLRQAQAARAADDAAAKGYSTATAVTLASLTQSEMDANVDFIMGEPGYSARQRVETMAARQARAAQREAEERAYTEWAAANPEEARKQQEAEDKKEARNAARRTGRRSYGGGKADKTDWGAYRSGRDAGGSISLDPQMDSTSGARARIARAK